LKDKMTEEDTAREVVAAGAVSAAVAAHFASTPRLPVQMSGAPFAAGGAGGLILPQGPPPPRAPSSAAARISLPTIAPPAADNSEENSEDETDNSADPDWSESLEGEQMSLSQDSSVELSQLTANGSASAEEAAGASHEVDLWAAAVASAQDDPNPPPLLVKNVQRRRI